jgi:hypothetical protein
MPETVYFCKIRPILDYSVELKQGDGRVQGDLHCPLISVRLLMAVMFITRQPLKQNIRPEPQERLSNTRPNLLFVMDFSFTHTDTVI